MTVQNIITTLAGAFIFPFMIRLLWGKFVEDFGSIGGWMAAGFIVGTAWTINHGVGLIVQTGAWVDMAWAAGTGLFLADVFAGKKINGSTILAGILGGIIGGFFLSTFL